MSTPVSRETEAKIAAETLRLADEFRGTFGKESIETVVAEAREQFADAKIEAYLPVLVYRFAREVLRATAKLGRLQHSGKPEVLFVCLRNAGRSQIAAALVRHLAGFQVVVRSAGSMPASEIHPSVVEALREVGLDIGEEFPKPLADAFVRAADVVITMGCGDACPVYPGRRYEDWDVPDPAGKSIEEVRAIREEIRTRVTRLLAELGVAVDPSR